MKRFAAALTLTTAVLAFAPVPLTAQTGGRQGSTAAPQPAAPLSGPGYTDPNLDADTIKQQFHEVLRRYPRSVPRVLRLDPRLMSDPSYMANYPAIQQFVAQYPDVARNPEFYLAEYSTYYQEPYSERAQAISVFRNFIEGITILLVAITVSLGTIWIIKAIIDHRRWIRLTKTQTEVHTKLLDRFGSSEELLAYMKTPAGAKFLESAPIALDAASPRAMSAPLNRILWSVQAGIILLLGGLTLVWSRHQVTEEEVKQMFFMMGAFGSAIGIGFVLSAAASYALSRKLGLFDGTAGTPRPSISPRVDSTGI